MGGLHRVSSFSGFHLMLLHHATELSKAASASRAVVTPLAMLSRAEQSCVCPLQGRGGSTGYDNAVALPARSDSDELAKENTKSTVALKGQAVFSVAKIDTETNEIAGELVLACLRRSLGHRWLHRSLVLHFVFWGFWSVFCLLE